MPIKSLSFEDFVNIAELIGDKPITIDCVYAKPEHPDNHFTIRDRDHKIPIYRTEYADDDALWLHKTMAKIVADASAYLEPGQSISVKDGFRPIEAQMAMQRVAERKYNGKTIPETLLSAPGDGGHPRGLAVDVMLVGKDGHEVDVGTPFDYLDIFVNPHNGNLNTHPIPKSSRENPDLSDAQKHNQRILERAMMRSALEQGVLLEPLEEEHWDFRIPDDVASLKYVLKSVARIIGVEIHKTDSEITPRDYEDFKALWSELFSGHEDALRRELGVIAPPEHAPIFANDYHPLSDRDLPRHMQMTSFHARHYSIAPTYARRLQERQTEGSRTPGDRF